MFMLNPLFPNATHEQKWDQFRLYRLQQLQLTDFTQNKDCELSKDEIDRYTKYRKFLRNAPNSYSQVEDIEFPAYVAMIDYKMVLIEGVYTVKKS